VADHVADDDDEKRGHGEQEDEHATSGTTTAP
jgi:hypothetical protein